MVTPRKLYTKKPYRPSDEDRAKAATAIAKMVVANIDQDMIAKILGISRKTLRKYYSAELDTAYAITLAKVAGNIVHVAGDTEHRDFAKMAQFYMETHGWIRSERMILQDTDADPTALSDAEIEARIAKLRRTSATRRT